MSDEQLAQICKVAGEAGGNAAIKRYKEETRTRQRELADKRYHNTELLLINYNRLKLSVEKAVFDIHQVEDEQGVKEILDLMMGRDDTDLMIQSIKTSKAKTAIIVKHIDAMIQAYKSLCSSSRDQLDQRRFEILIDRYVRGMSVNEISEKYFLSTDSVYLDLKNAKKALSALIFGIDGALMDE